MTAYSTGARSQAESGAETRQRSRVCLVPTEACQAGAGQAPVGGYDNSQQLLDLGQAEPVRLGEEDRHTRTRIEHVRVESDVDGLHTFERGWNPGGIPVEPAPLPRGVTVRAFRPGVDDETFHAVLNEAFAEHWGHVEETFDRWKEITIASPRFDPGLWLIAEESGEMLAIARCTWKVNEIGWVNDLGVRPSARRRGLALGLLTRAFAEFYRRGERTVGLGVDTQNETGATRLYDQAGMHAVYRSVIFQKRVS